MKHVTLEHATILLDVMTITQSIDSEFAITHHGYIGGQPTILISTSRGSGDCNIIH